MGFTTGRIFLLKDFEMKYKMEMIFEFESDDVIKSLNIQNGSFELIEYALDNLPQPKVDEDSLSVSLTLNAID